MNDKRVWPFEAYQRVIAVFQSVGATPTVSTQPKYGDTVLNPERPLTGAPGQYLTGTYPGWETSGYEADRDPWGDVPEGWSGVPQKDLQDVLADDVNNFYKGLYRRECEQIDEDKS